MENVLTEKQLHFPKSKIDTEPSELNLIEYSKFKYTIYLKNPFTQCQLFSLWKLLAFTSFSLLRLVLFAGRLGQENENPQLQNFQSQNGVLAYILQSIQPAIISMNLCKYCIIETVNSLAVGSRLLVSFFLLDGIMET